MPKYEVDQKVCTVENGDRIEGVVKEHLGDDWYRVRVVEGAVGLGYGLVEDWHESIIQLVPTKD